MKKQMTTILFTLLAAGLSAQQMDFSKVKEAKLEAMEKLDIMVGEWKGTGWSAMGPNNKEEFVIYETITKKIDGLLLAVEGLGKDLNEERVVHNAFATLSYDIQSQIYNFNTFLYDGRATEATATFENGMLVWRFEIEGWGETRYTIDLTKPGHWNEIGEYSGDGENWNQFMEMNLERIDK